jgi:hypothetical protein
MRKNMERIFARNCKINIWRGLLNQSAILTKDVQLSAILCGLPVMSVQ